MKLFTWNLNNNEAMAELAVEYLELLAVNDAVVACFQEWPENHDASLSRLSLTGSHRRLRTFHSTAELDVVWPPHPDEFERSMICHFEGKARKKPLSVVNLHWHHRSDDSGISISEERAGRAAIFRQSLARHLPSKSFVVMGDFNIDEEGSHRNEFRNEWSMFVRRRGTKVGPVKRIEQTIAPWIYVPPEDSHVKTFMWKGEWLQIDHILFADDLAKFCDKVSVLPSFGIPPRVMSNFLTRKNNLRDKKYASDHLPLLCEFNF
jgi:hypothetical protein